MGDQPGLVAWRLLHHVIQPVQLGPEVVLTRPVPVHHLGGVGGQPLAAGHQDPEGVAVSPKQATDTHMHA